MWHSRLYSDTLIALTINFSRKHHHLSTTPPICPPLLHRPRLLAFPSKTFAEPLTLTLLPIHPASLHFTLGFIYKGTLVYSHSAYTSSTGPRSLFDTFPELPDHAQLMGTRLCRNCQCWNSGCLMNHDVMKARVDRGWEGVWPGWLPPNSRVCHIFVCGGVFYGQTEFGG